LVYGFDLCNLTTILANLTANYYTSITQSSFFGKLELRR
jgi:hypothetical protein